MNLIEFGISIIQVNPSFVRTYTSYTKNKSGMWVPTPLPPEVSQFEKSLAFLLKQWKRLDQRYHTVLVINKQINSVVHFNGVSADHVNFNGVSAAPRVPY